MSGRIKHMQRSHRSYSNKDVEFRRFAVKAIKTGEQKKQHTIGKKIKETLGKIFHRHQDK